MMRGMTEAGCIACAILRVPQHGIALFRAYEDAVLPLLNGHGGTLQRRLRTDDGTTEIHIIWFPSAAHFDAYRADPARACHVDLLLRSGAVAEVFMVEDT